MIARVRVLSIARLALPQHQHDPSPEDALEPIPLPQSLFHAPPPRPVLVLLSGFGPELSIRDTWS
jgi:hypothetical protein